MERLGSFILRHRLAVLGVFVLLLGWALASLPQVRFSFSLMPILQADEDTQAAVEAFQNDVPPKFYDQIFCLEFPRPLAAEELKAIQELALAIRQGPNISQCIALSDTLVVEHQGMIPLPTRFMDTLRPGESALDAAARHPLLLQRLISKEGHATTLLVNSEDDSQEGQAHLLSWLEDLTGRIMPPEVRARFIGDEVSKRAMKNYMGTDLKQGLLLELLVFAILLPMIFRTVRGIIIPLSTVLVSQAFCGALLVLAGLEIGLIDLAIPGIITMIAVCDAVHMMHRFEESMVESKDRRKALLDMMARVGPACFFTSLTTAIGFLSLIVARHPAVRLFGIKASLAVFIAFATIVTLIPLALSFWPVRRGVPARVPGTGGLGYGRRPLTLSLFGAVLLFALFGIARINVDSHWLEEMPAEEPLIQDLAWYEEHFSGIMTMDVRLQGALDDPEIFAATEAFQERMLQEHGVNKVESYTHWVREILGKKGPLTHNELKSALAMLKGMGKFFPSHVINPGLRTGRISFLTDDQGTSRFFALRDLVDRLNDNLPEGFHMEVAGFMEMAHEASRLIVTTMLESFLISLLVISLLITAIFRSFRIGLVSVIPNLFPILVALGLNGWLDINLRIGIVMIYSLGLGLAVDDTIHLITRYRQERRKNPWGNARGQILTALRGCGPALVTTSIVLAVGSLSYLPSSFRSLRDVGLLLTMIVVMAVLADLFLLPHLLEMASRSRRKPEGD